MHAFLINTTNEETIQKEVHKILKDKTNRTLDFRIKSINDARNFINYLNLKLVEPTAFLIKNLDLASNEALNALLKVSEEPQDDAIVIATCKNTHLLPPTIISRFHIITVKETDLIENNDIERFIKSSISKQFSTTDKIKDREEALLFLNKIEAYCQNLIKNKTNLDFAVGLAEITQKTLSAVKANGNINLQFTNFIVIVNELKAS